MGTLVASWHSSRQVLHARRWHRFRYERPVVITPLDDATGQPIGEPLLAANRPIVEYLIRRAVAVGGADLWAVTNATELEAYRDLLGPTALARLQITLDGRPDEHDRRRIDATGSGSYERIARNIDLALEHGAQVSVRLNVDRNNLESLVDVADELVARSWDRHPGARPPAGGAPRAPCEPRRPGAAQRQPALPGAADLRRQR